MPVSWQRRLEEEEEMLGEMRRRMMRRSEWKVFAHSWKEEGIADCAVESISVQSSGAFYWSDETLSRCQGGKLKIHVGCFVKGTTKQ